MRHVALIESTLREGEQFTSAFFTSEQKIELARLLDAFGVDCLELTSPAASPRSLKDCEKIAGLGLKAKVLTHTRCHLDDARTAVETGVDGVNLVLGISPALRAWSHGKAVEEVFETACEVIAYVQKHGVEARFSSEDAFRTDLVDLLTLYRQVDRQGVDRVGVADTVGSAHPEQVAELIRTVRGVVACDIEFHGHDDTGCAVANAYAAYRAGATHIDTSVLGLGERNGITSLGAFVARLYADDPEPARQRFELTLLREIERYVATLVGVDVPFNNCITGRSAFSHKAGIHTKAVLRDPRSYEALDPADFGLSRSLVVGHRLTGWNVIKARSEELGLALSDADIKDLTARIKARGDEGLVELEELDTMLVDEVHRVA